MISRKAPFRIAGTADFDQVFSEMSGIAEWCQQGTSIPVSDLSTHRGARNVLVDTATDPDYLVRVGDSLAVTDPQLGQGASLAAWETGVLVEELASNSPAAAAKRLSAAGGARPERSGSPVAVSFEVPVSALAWRFESGMGWFGR
jgi:hypothetical protein